MMDVYNLIRIVPGTNLIRYQFGGEAVIVDCGATPQTAAAKTEGLEGPQIPASVFKDVVAVLNTHGHYDHWSQLGQVLPSGVPVYVTPFVQHLLLAQRELDSKAGLERVVSALGIFKPGDWARWREISVNTFSITHSIPQAVAFVFRSGGKTILHLGEFKFEHMNPLVRFEFAANLAKLGRHGVDLLVMDVQNVSSDVFTPSERVVIESIGKIIAGERQRRIIISSFASNLERVEALAQVAKFYGHPVQLYGAGMRKIREFVPTPNGDGLTSDVIFIPGCQGEENSGLTKLANGSHENLELTPQDLVVISSRAIPGNEGRVRELCVNLCARKVSLVLHKGERYRLRLMSEKSIREEVTHTSGHASGRDVAEALRLLKPKHLIARPLLDRRREERLVKILAEVSPSTTLLSEERLVFDDS